MPLTIAQAINRALHDLCQSDERVWMLGEDTVDPYGGAFKITRGLSTRWPGRVLATPISEAGLCGLAAGMALRGLRPVVEIMFGDFLTLAFDQLVNHIAKFNRMYDGRATCPVTIRTPMGGRRGYGPTHSQSLEKFLVGIPGLQVAAISPFHPAGPFYRKAVLESEDPTVIIENKLAYGWPVADPGARRHGDFYLQPPQTPWGPAALSLNDFKAADVTIVTWGGMTHLALEAALRVLLSHEIRTEVVILGQLAPLADGLWLEWAHRTGRVLCVEEGTARLGVGAELAAMAMEKLWPALKAPVGRVAAADTAIPCDRDGEDAVLPGLQAIENAILKCVQ